MSLNRNIKALKDLCDNFKADIVDGPFGSNMKRSDYTDKGIPVLKIQNIKPFKLEIKNMDFVQKSKYEELKRHSYQNGDIVMTKLGDPLGASAIVEENIDDGLIVADLVRIRAQKVNTAYLCYHLNSPNTNDFINSQQKGATRPRVQISVVRDLPIYAPPLQEQQRIVAILDKAFAAIAKLKANAEQNLKNARELFESYLQGVFETRGEGWEEKRLGEVCLVERGSSPRPINKYFTDSVDGVNWIKIGDTKDVDRYIYTTKEKITKEGASKSRYVKEGDFILSNSMSFGKPYIMKTDGYIHDGWFVLRLPPHIDSEFFWYLLASPFTMNQFNLLAAGAIVKNISGDLVKRTILPLPPLKEQQTIVAKLDALSAETKKLESIYQQKINNLEELKKSILQKAFNGELDTEKDLGL